MKVEFTGVGEPGKSQQSAISVIQGGWVGGWVGVDVCVSVCARTYMHVHERDRDKLLLKHSVADRYLANLSFSNPLLHEILIFTIPFYMRSYPHFSDKKQGSGR